MKKMYYVLLTLCLGLFCTFSMNAQNQQPFTIQATSANASSGENVCIDVEVHGAYTLLSMQYSMNYDPTVLTFESIQNFNLPDLNDASFATSEGNIRVSWLDHNDVAQATTNGQSLYQVCFNVIGAAGTFSEVTFGEHPTPFEIISAGDVSLPVSHIGGQVLVGSDSALSVDAFDVTSIDCLDANLGAIDISVSGGTAPYEYNWTDGRDVVYVTEDLSAIGSGTYSLIITDAANTTVSAVFQINPSEQNLISNSDITNTTCSQNDGSIHLSPINDFSIVFNWDFGATTELVTGLSAGTYTVTITDTEVGCQQVESFTVTDGEIFAAANYSCNIPLNAELNVAIWGGGTAPYTVSLNNEVTTTVGDSEIATFVVEPNATYTVKVLDANGCATTIVQEVACGGNNSELIVGTSYHCSLPGTATLSAILWNGGLPPYSFSIDGGLTFVTTNSAEEVVTFPVTPEATYHVSVTDASGMVAHSTITIDCDNTPTYAGNLFLSSPQITVEPNASFCIPVVVDSFLDVNSLQFAMSWNKDIVSFTGVDNYATALDLNNSNFGLSNEPLEDGILRFSWMDNEVSGVDLPNGSTMFEVCFSVIGNPGSSSNFNFINAPIPVEATNSSLEFIQVSNSNGTINISGDPTNGVTFIASDEITLTDEEVCVDISVENFTDILTMQFSMQWDADVLSYNSLQFPTTALTEFDESVFGVASSNTNQGRLAVSWFESDAMDGITLADGTVIFQVCFEARGDNGESSAIQFTNFPAITEITNDSNQHLTFIGQDGLVTIDMDGFVLPGDTDHDLEANHYDLLNIGLGFGQTGSPRADASLEFMPQLSEDWGSSTPNSGLDYKHADTDGNGVINADDMLGIIVNWGESLNFLEHENTSSFENLEGTRELMAPFFVLPDTVNPGGTASFPIILGTPIFPVTDIYGVAFTLLYDSDVIVAESVTADFEESWLGALDSDMISIQKDFYNTGQIDIAITRTDGQAINGAGQIGSINVIIEDVIFRSDSEYELVFNITDVRAISPTEEPLVFLATETTSIINTEPLSTVNSELEQFITILPNPAQDYFHIQTEDIKVNQIDLYNINGQLLKRYEPTNKIATTDLASGTYLIKLITESGVVSKRVVVQR